MITGFGRTGKMFGVEHTGIGPGHHDDRQGHGERLPGHRRHLDADEISSAEPLAKPSGASSSYGGNPLAATAALATLETILDEELVEHSATLGAVMLGRLRAMQEKYEFIGDVRGRRPADRPRPGQGSQDQGAARPAGDRAHLPRCLRRGLLLMGYIPRVRINPPLTITREEMDQGLGILDEVFAEVARDRSYR